MYKINYWSVTAIYFKETKVIWRCFFFLVVVIENKCIEWHAHIYNFKLKLSHIWKLYLWMHWFSFIEQIYRRHSATKSSLMWIAGLKWNYTEYWWLVKSEQNLVAYFKRINLDGDIKSVELKPLLSFKVIVWLNKSLLRFFSMSFLFRNFPIFQFSKVLATFWISLLYFIVNTVEYALS